METQRRVVLYGDTVVLAGVGRALAARPGLRVISLDPSRATAPADLDALRPCTLILDLTVVSAESALALAQGRPDLLLIGLEPGGDRLLVLSGEQARGLTTEDLVHLIDTGVPVQPERPATDVVARRSARTTRGPSVAPRNVSKKGGP